MPTEKELLEREIAKLTGEHPRRRLCHIISTDPSSYIPVVRPSAGVIAGKNKNLTHGHPKATNDARAAGHPYSKPRGGRVIGNKTFRPGQNQSLILNNNNNHHNNQASVASSSAGSSSLNVPSGSSSTANNPVDTSINAVADPPTGIPTRTSKEEEEGRWVNNTSRHGNKSLINPEIYLQQLVLAPAVVVRRHESETVDAPPVLYLVLDDRSTLGKQLTQAKSPAGAFGKTSVD